MGNVDAREKEKLNVSSFLLPRCVSSENIFRREIKILKTCIQKYISGSHQEITSQCGVPTQ